jgi:protein TonB
VLSLAIHAALLAWPRWPSWHEAGGGDPGLAARIVTQTEVARHASATTDSAEPVKPAMPAARADAPARSTPAPPRAVAPPLSRPPETERAAALASSQPVTTPAAGTAPRASAVNAGEAPGAAKAPGNASDIASVAQYRIALMSAARPFLRAPDSAGAPGVEGRVEVRLAIAADGSLARAEVARSSGHAALDELALEALRNAKAGAPVPPALLAREFEVEVPVVFGAPR